MVLGGYPEMPATWVLPAALFREDKLERYRFKSDAIDEADTECP